MRIIVAGGGSGGHTSAAVAIATMLRDLSPDAGLLWIGSAGGVEREVAKRSDIAFQVISVGKFRRYWSIDNLLDAPRIIRGIIQSICILRKVKPDVVVGTGGFVSVPVVIGARILSIPVVVHEQTVVPGLANRIAGRFAARILLSHAEAAGYFKGNKTVVVGNPLRRELKTLPDRASALERLGLDPTLPILYVTGGAQGSRALNRLIIEALPALLVNWQVIHQCGNIAGEYSFDALKRRLDKIPQGASHYVLTPYIADELADVLAAADVLVTRSGAAIINEIIHLGLASVLVPYPHSVGNEQQLLAEKLCRAGAAIVLDERAASVSVFLDALAKLESAESRERFRIAAKRLGDRYPEDQFVASITDVARKH